MKKLFYYLMPVFLLFSLVSTTIIKNETTNGPTKAIKQKTLQQDIDTPIVYMTTDLSSDGLIAIYKALGREATGNVAVKLHSGEPGGNHYLKPDFIKELVQKVNGTIVECNTAYGGGRANTALHEQVMIDHGFTAIAPTDIMDKEGEISIPVPNGDNIEEDFVGSHFSNYDFFIILTHFKGHTMGGFGGALKNMSIGIASSKGKSWIHSAGTSTSGLSGDHDLFLESMAEAAYAVADYLGDSIIYINVMNNLSVDCDCDNSPAAPTMGDIGILASLDPVALDKACVDLVYAAHDGHDLIERMESRNGIHTLDHAVEIGFGTQAYNLVSIDSASSGAFNYKNTDKAYFYPNPANNIITIPHYLKYDFVRICDINGRNTMVIKSKAEIAVDYLDPGHYLVQFIADNQTVKTSPLIIE